MGCVPENDRPLYAYRHCGDLLFTGDLSAAFDPDLFGRSKLRCMRSRRDKPVHLLLFESMKTDMTFSGAGKLKNLLYVIQVTEYAY